MGKHVWLKIIAVIIIQALLLTQAEFALAAICHSNDTFQEAALKFQRITNKSASLIIGIGCVQLSLNSLNLPHLNLNNLFSLLSGNSASTSEIISAKELRSLSNGIYKALICLFDKINYDEQVFLAYKNTEDKRAIISRTRTEKSTGPPIVNAKIERVNIGRIVEFNSSAFSLSNNMSFKTKAGKQNV